MKIMETMYKYITDTNLIMLQDDEIIESFDLEEQNPIIDAYEIELIFGDSNHQIR